MARYLSAYLATLMCVGTMDFFWLTQVGPHLYKPVLGPILVAEPRMVPAVLFYLLYVIGIVYFAVVPALNERRWQVALVRGGLFGIFSYATYDLTNQATLIVWATKITVLDIAWGMVLSGVGGTGGYLITSRLFRK